MIEPPEHFGGVTGVSVLSSPAIKRLRRVLPRATRPGFPTGVLVSGPFATGKSFGSRLALLQSAAELGWRIVWTSAIGPLNADGVAVGRMTDIELCRTLGSKIDGVEWSGGKFREYRDDLIALMASDKIMPVIDEADELTATGLNFVQSLLDNPATRCPAILIGTLALRRRIIGNVSALDSRLPYKVTFVALTDNEAASIMPSYHPRYGNTDAAVLRFVNAALLGRLRSWAHFTAELDELLPDRSDPLTFELATYVLRDLVDDLEEVIERDQADASD